MCSYILENGICYLCVCDRSYPRKLAFSYLEELSKEFDASFGAEAQKPGLRPYAFIKFGMNEWIKGEEGRERRAVTPGLIHC